MAGSGDDLNVDKVKAALRKQRADAGHTPTTGTPAIPPEQESQNPPASPSPDDPSPEKARAMLKQTRACAIRNSQSCEQLREAQASTPGRGVPTSKFRTRGASPPSGAMQAPGDAKQKKEPS